MTMIGISNGQVEHVSDDRLHRRLMGWSAAVFRSGSCTRAKVFIASWITRERIEAAVQKGNVVPAGWKYRMELKADRWMLVVLK